MSDAPPPIQLAFSRETKFRFLSVGALQPVTRPYLVKGVLPSRGLGFIAGEKSSGKTFVTMDTTFRIACGAPFAFKRKVNQAGVLYIAAEDPDGVNNRALGWIKRAKMEANWWRPEMEDPPFKLVTGRIDLLDPDSIADFAAGARLERDQFAAAGVRLGCVVLDTFSRGLPGVDENNAQQMSLAIQALEDLGKELDCLILIVAHHGKSGGGGGIRGWSGVDAASDATITITRDKEDKTRRFIEFTKVKNGVDGGILGFNLDPIDIGTDEDGEPISTATIRLSQDSIVNAPKPARKIALRPDEGLVLRALAWCTDRGPYADIPPSEQAPAYAKGVSKAVLRGRAEHSGFCDDLGPPSEGEEDAAERKKRLNARVQRFSRALDGLVSKGKIRRAADVVWLISGA